MNHPSEFYRAVLESAIEGLVVVDAGGTVHFANSSAFGLAGVTGREPIGRPVSEFLDLRDPGTGLGIELESLPAPESASAFQGRMCLLVSPAGTEKYVEVSVFSMPPCSPGMEPCLLYHIVDATWRRVAEDSIRNSNRLFNSIVENSFDAIYILRGRRYEYVNPSFCAITGYSYVELTASDFDYNVLISPESREFMERRFLARSKGAAVDPRYRIHVLRKTGEVVEVEVVTVPIGKPDDILVLGIMRDITGRRRAEREAGEASEMIYGILGAMYDSVFRFDTEGRFVFAHSPSIALITTPERFIGRHYSEILPKGVSELMNQAMDILRRGERTEFDYSLDIAGVTHSYSTVLAPIVNRGEFSGVVATVRDVTEIRRAETEQKALAEQLQRTQLFESLGMLAGGIAHDFNNILMAILGNTSAVMEEIKGPESAMQRLVEIEASSGRAVELCRQMLAYAGRDTASMEKLDLNAVIHGIEDLLSVNIPPAVKLDFILARDLPTVDADELQIGQIVMNLVKNAFEALPETGGTVTVRTGRACFDGGSLRGFLIPAGIEPGEFVTLEVSDDGSGMESWQKERIFDPFYSTRGPGRGLGLAAVLGIVKAHGGSVRVFSENGLGTTFQVLLPVSAGPGGQPVPEAPPDRPERDLSGMILVVDDEEIVRNVLERMLVKIGYGVVCAASGMEAVNIFRKRRGGFDAVILDLAMPGMEGPEVLELLRSMDPTVRIVIASGYSPQQVEERMGNRKPDAVLQKPFRMDKLQEILGPPPGPASVSPV